jgi:hypothetical protein
VVIAEDWANELCAVLAIDLMPKYAVVRVPIAVKALVRIDTTEFVPAVPFFTQ